MPADFAEAGAPERRPALPRNVGFLGAGTLTAAVVTAIRTRGATPVLHLSPRSEAVSTRLAARLPKVIRHTDNQAVLDASEVVVIAVRPQDVEAVLRPLCFRADHVVVSFVAGLETAEVSPLVQPAGTVARVTPLPAIAIRQGPILIYPAVSTAVALFSGLGDILVPRTEAEMTALGWAGGLMSTYFELQAVAIDALVERGAGRGDAERYLRSMLLGLAATNAAAPHATPAALVTEHETRGGLNEGCRGFLHDRGWFSTYREAVVGLSSRLRLRPPDSRPG